MATTFTFQYEVSPDLIAPAAETVLAAYRAGRPPQRLRAIAIAEAVICAQLLGLLIVSIALEFPDWLVWSAALALAVFGLWTGVLVFILAMYPRNRDQYERLVAEAFEKLDSPWVRWTLTDDGFIIDSRTTHTEVAWGDVGEGFVGRTFWILAPAHRQQFLLPVSALPPGAERFLLDRLTRAGSKVRIEQGHPLDAK